MTQDTGSICSLSCHHMHDCTTAITVQKQHWSPDLYIICLNVNKDEWLLQKARFLGKTTYHVSYNLKSSVAYPFWMTWCEFNRFVQIILCLFIIVMDDKCFKWTSISKFKTTSPQIAKPECWTGWADVAICSYNTIVCVWVRVCI